MPTIADSFQSAVDTGRTNLQNWKNSVRGGAKSAGLGNGQGPLGFGILGGSRLRGSPLGMIQEARQKAGDVIAGRGTARLVRSRVTSESNDVVASSAPVHDDPVLP